MPLLLLAALPAAGPAAPVATADRPPNVVLVVVGDLGARDLGCDGSTFHRTPHLDALAKAGLRFTDFSTAAPVGPPTRAAVLTGRHPARLGVTDAAPGRGDRPDQRLRPPSARADLPADADTVSAALARRGYATAHVGGDDPLAAEAFIDKHKDRPFFLSLTHDAGHPSPRALVDKYRVTPAHGRQSNPAYAARLEAVDAGVGRVLKQLDDLKLAADTLVIVTSDNGGVATRDGRPFAPTINTPFREGKGYLYDGGVRVPCLMRWPAGIEPGTVTDAVASSVDLCDTILDVAGAAGDRRDGVSLRPLFRGDRLPDRAVYWHYPHYSDQGGRPGGAVRRGEYKLVEYFEDGRRELFDLKRDVGEGRNLAADRPEVAARLAADLAAWRKAVGAKVPTPNPGYRPNPPDRDGVITLHARTALVQGTMLRFEPLPHKDTLGYWVNRDDTATFDFTVETPGTFAVEVLQGCGTGSGGAEVELAVGGQKLTFTVKETGGFQQFEARAVGTLTIETAGRHTLTVRAKTKPGPAVMDLRQVVLRPAK